MAIYIYNTLSRAKEEFRPLKKGAVDMYVCGPTVYDEAHIGHGRAAFVFAVVKNYFEYRGYKVKYVRNITDVDDKIIAKAREIAKPGEDIKAKAKEVAERYLASYRDDMKGLGIPGADIEPRATEYIGEMLDVINGLIKKGYAYKSGGDVYFRVRRAKDYGKLSNQSLEMMESGARVKPGEGKDDPLDFALWKRSKEDEPSWRGGDLEGRPGWHIECSAMSMKNLGETFDIHGGGVDLVFPHHENEIAQSEAATGKPFARYWMHNGLLTINGQKMAKSLGNYISVKEYIGKYGDPDLLKTIFLSSHYRSPVDFTEEKIREAHLAKERILIFFDKADNLAKKTRAAPGVPEAAKAVTARMRADFEKAMDDDFNTALAVAALFEGVREGNELLGSGMGPGGKAAAAGAVKGLIQKLGGVLGLSFGKRALSQEEVRRIEGKMAEREAARRNKDFKLADGIRAVLSDEGIIIEDTQTGPTWRLK